ncbi:MAG: beta galactosidase jelly roll domain-containing protein [Saprospiraceae bacterium]|nr:beta galactosidase jelly roll domain-containing protein [Saprospiraceae bacterium]
MKFKSGTEHRFFIRLFCLSLIVFSSTVLRAAIKLPHLFGDHMVLQRNRPLTIWGWADSGERIEVRLGSVSATAFANSDGKWSCSLPSMDAGGPFTIRIKGENEISFEDVMIGDVWVASGQSNMQWQVRQTSYVELDSQWILDSPLRLFTVQISSDYMPQDDVQGGNWQRLSQESIADFSAVAYHFARHIQRNQNIPIGIISSSLGATSIETWMSNQSLSEFDQFIPEIQPIIDRGKSFAEINAEFDAAKPAWEKRKYLTGPGIDQKWFLPETDLSQWREIDVPGFWEDQGLEDHDGAVWYRKEFDMPPGAEGHDSLLLQLSQIDDYDITWVNGKKIGETYGRHNHRNYWMPKRMLKDKGNVLVVRAFDIGGKGGFSTNAFWMSELVRGRWKMRPGLEIDSDQFQTQPTVNTTPFSSPGVLFNANIAPLTRFPVKGVIWYQGESNAERAEEYRDLFTTMIKDWRNHWQDSLMPFLFVQLANYQAENTQPEPSDWAELREAQTLALKLPATGMAVTIDIGEAGDIHPKNKHDVGLRLSLAAENIAYGETVIWHGPRKEQVQFLPNEVLITYDSAGGIPITTDKFGYVHGFEVAGADRKFYWAKAEIQGRQVRVFADQVAEPVAVRYAWSDNPGTIDLYNRQGLPALPFRTDQWPGITSGRVFDHQAARF